MSSQSGPAPAPTIDQLSPAYQLYKGYKPEPGTATLTPGMPGYELWKNQQGVDAQAAGIADRNKLREDIKGSTQMSTLVKQDLLLQIGNSRNSTADVAAAFAKVVDPNGSTFQDFTLAQTQRKAISDTPGIGNQTLLTQGLAPQNTSLLTGGGR